MLISYKILVDLLGLPPETEIHGARPDPYGSSDRFELLVEHPSFRDVDAPTISDIPEIEPRYTSVGGQGVFSDWGHK